jgi:carbamoyl-phosphate synthase large subunit
MQIVANEGCCATTSKTPSEINEDRPVLVDRYIAGKELEVDAVCDGTDVFVPGIMELVERTGVHSGDSISVYPTFSLSSKVKGPSWTTPAGWAWASASRPVQHPVHRGRSEDVYVIEVNPRSSRTVPFLSKATGYNRWPTSARWPSSARRSRSRASRALPADERTSAGMSRPRPSPSRSSVGWTPTSRRR